MGVYAVYFSATGNTQKSVKEMAGAIVKYQAALQGKSVEEVFGE